MNIDDRPTTDDRPQGLFTHFGKTSNGYISAMHYPIHCMYVRKPYFALGLLSIMIEIRNLFHEGGSPADLRYKEEERKRP